MQGGFLYLVAVMDWATRRVLAWRLSNTMDTEFCLEALNEALERYGTPQIFNTDQGSQFTSIAFTAALKDAGIRCSMDGRGRCLDNAFIERLWRSLSTRRCNLRELADGTPALGARWPHAGQGARRAWAGTRKGGGIADVSIRWRERAKRASAAT